jgi:hypothetical protein
MQSQSLMTEPAPWAMHAFRGALKFADGTPIQEVGGVLRRVTSGKATCHEGRMEVDARRLARLMLAEGEEFLLDLADGPLLRITVESAHASSGWVTFLGTSGRASAGGDAGGERTGKLTG